MPLLGFSTVTGNARWQFGQLRRLSDLLRKFFGKRRQPGPALPTHVPCVCQGVRLRRAYIVPRGTFSSASLPGRAVVAVSHLIRNIGSSRDVEHGVEAPTDLLAPTELAHRCPKASIGVRAGRCFGRATVRSTSRSSLREAEVVSQKLRLSAIGYNILVDFGSQSETSAISRSWLSSPGRRKTHWAPREKYHRWNMIAL
jgi:hypothetical protein